MSKLKVGSFGRSLDGFGAGPAQSQEHPLGRGGEALHAWAFPTRTFARMLGKEGGTTGAGRGFRGERLRQCRRPDPRPQHLRAGSRPVADQAWKGWWGANPPYHVPVFVLRQLGFEPTRHVGTASAMHVVLTEPARAAG